MKKQTETRPITDVEYIEIKNHVNEIMEGFSKYFNVPKLPIRVNRTSRTSAFWRRGDVPEKIDLRGILAPSKPLIDSILHELAHYLQDTKNPEENKNIMIELRMKYKTTEVIQKHYNKMIHRETFYSNLKQVIAWYFHADLTQYSWSEYEYIQALWVKDKSKFGS